MQRAFQPVKASTVPRVLLPLLLMFFFAMSVCIGYLALIYQPGYPVGDWLINYSDGFVRRGLPGELLLLTSGLVHVPIPWLAMIGPAILYGLFLFLTYYVARTLRFGSLLLALLFSPAAIPFLVLNVLEIGYRKETIACGGLALVIVLLGKRVANGTVVMTLVVVFTAMMLSHEAMIICLPFFPAAVLLATRNVKRAFLVSLPAFLVAGALLLAVQRNPGDLHGAQTVCRSVGGQWVDTPPGEYPGMDWEHHQGLCSGAIAWLTVSRTGYHQQMIETQTRYIPAMTKRVLLAFLPLLLALWQMYDKDKLRYEVTVITITSAVCFVGVLALCYSTLDWGRWIYMWNVCTVLLILMAAQHASSFHKAAAGTPSSPGFLLRCVAFPLLAVVYCSTWTLPVNGGYLLRNGYRDAVKRAMWVVPHRQRQQAAGELSLYGEPAGR